MRRLWPLLALTLLACGGVVVLALRLVLPATPPVAVEPRPPEHEPLTRRLALVIVDGLRYDIATDPEWMPFFAAAMERHAGGMVMAGEITMTSSAVLAYGTGKPGDLDQIVFNETARQTPFNDLIDNAERAGLRLAATGDVSWFQLYEGWDLEHRDPANVALEVDYNDEIFAAARRFAAADPPVHLLIAHFVSPDHQAHAHGVFSDAYRTHIRGFDDELRELLALLGDDTTVFVTSDHGATDRGKHGSDAQVMRACPLFAYGPGIRKGWRPSAPAAQIDLAATFAYLLGIAQPAHAEGHILASWLDLSPAERARAACASWARAHHYAAAVAGAEQADAAGGAVCRSPEHGEPERVREAVASLAALVNDAEPTDGTEAWVGLLVLVVAFSLLALGWMGPARRLFAERPGRIVLVVVTLTAISLTFTRHVENLPAPWPVAVPAALMVLANLALLGAVLFLPRAAALVDRHGPELGVVAAGLLVASYASYTRVETYIIAAITAIVVLVSPVARRVGLAPPRQPNAWLRAAVALGALALLWRAVAARDQILPDALVARGGGQLAMLAVALVVFAAERLSRRRDERNATTVVVAFVLGSLALWAARGQRELPAAAALTLWLALPIGAAIAWRRGRRTMAEMSGVACFALVARPHELFVLLATALVAEVVGEAMAAALARHHPDAAPRPAVVAAIAVFAFSLAYLQRIGVQSGIDFHSIDWTAGTFDSTRVGYLRIGGANLTKHALARAAVLLGCLAALPPRYRDAAARAIVLAELGRAFVLSAMLLFCKQSFWTALRVLSELPHALLGLVVAAVSCALVRAPAGGERAEAPAAGTQRVAGVL